MMQTFQRTGEAVLTVCQDNIDKQVRITAANPAVEELTGLREADIAGQPLASILPEKIDGHVRDYVEFEDEANDLGAVLSRVRNFSLIGAKGREVFCKLKIIRSEAEKGRIWFKLVLQDDASVRRVEAVRRILQENFRGHEVLDEVTGLPDRLSMQKYLELVQYHANTNAIMACFAVLRLDHSDKLLGELGQAGCNRILTALASLCRQKLRGDDTVGSLGGSSIGILLIDISPEAARIVLNRLRWLISSHAFSVPPLESVSITVSVAYGHLGGGSSNHESLLEDCERALIEAVAKGGNTLVQVHPE